MLLDSHQRYSCAAAISSTIFTDLEALIETKLKDYLAEYYEPVKSIKKY